MNTLNQWGSSFTVCILLCAIQGVLSRSQQFEDYIHTDGLKLQSEYENAEINSPPISLWNGTNNAVEPPLFIGSFNIQTLAKKKLKQSHLMSTIERIVHRYDLILILELMTNDSQLTQRFLEDVNLFAPKGVVYNMTVSSDPHVNEFCAIFYRTDKLRILKTESYYDPDRFYRKPFFVLFDAPTLRDMKRFGLIGYHVKPSQAVRELDALVEVYDFMKKKYSIEDILFMGDFNADCDYVKEKDWEKIELWTNPTFTWLIDHSADTTTNYRSCALDRIVYAGENMNDGVIMSSARVFDYRQELDVTMEEARKISDHWPIEVKIRGKMSRVAEKHLTSNTCFSITDSRLPNVTSETIRKASRSAHFTATSVPSGISLRNETDSFELMLKAVMKLRRALPDVVTSEQEEAILFKANNGALEDPSSYADVQKEVFRVVVSILKDRTEVFVCRTTTIN
ncbi:deoxyribonuclease-1 [Trichonephila inaurata madagascariensis]|uniref:Deoxyribonuclease-1 n=2 Tax=Trichonephila inaurata madagascariensis TaxID=2747483 RepID=A0A8X6WSZ1_9ARAC|nr:deoxyribonuclease-1 [Trichonephila inaurata madagascariensis]